MTFLVTSLAVATASVEAAPVVAPGSTSPRSTWALSVIRRSGVGRDMGTAPGALALGPLRRIVELGLPLVPPEQTLQPTHHQDSLSRTTISAVSHCLEGMVDRASHCRWSGWALLLVVNHVFVTQRPWRGRPIAWTRRSGQSSPPTHREAHSPPPGGASVARSKATLMAGSDGDIAGGSAAHVVLCRPFSM